MTVSSPNSPVECSTLRVGIQSMTTCSVLLLGAPTRNAHSWTTPAQHPLRNFVEWLVSDAATTTLAQDIVPPMMHSLITVTIGIAMEILIVISLIKTPHKPLKLLVELLEQMLDVSIPILVSPDTVSLLRVLRVIATIPERPQPSSSKSMVQIIPATPPRKQSLSQEKVM